MSDRSLLIGLIVLAVILALAYWAYDKCYLDKYLAPKHQKCPALAAAIAPKTAAAAYGPFVGAMAQTPPLVPCAFPTSPSWNWNRCNAM